MIRRLFLAAIFATPSCLVRRLSAADDFTLRVVGFEKHWNRFIRRFFGCPDDGPTDRGTCKPERAVTDSEEFEASREKARRLFDLEEKPARGIP